MLVLIGLMIFWCGLAPVVGAFVIRRSWRIFRRRFDDLRLRPMLDYAAYREYACVPSVRERMEEGCTPPPLAACASEGGSTAPGENVFRFLGGVESLTDSHTLWVRSDTLTIPVSLTGALIYMLPVSEQGETPGFFDPGEEAPQRIRWDQVSTFTEGAKVFVGGALSQKDERWSFVSAKDHPLLVIFYDGPAHTLANRVIRAGRHRNEYFNPVTPYAFIFKAFSQILIAFSFLSRPAFRLTVITAVVAIFAPLFPLLPPGVLLTALYRQLWWRAKIFRAYRDLVMLPMKYLGPSQRGRLPDGEAYGSVHIDSQAALDTLPKQEKDEAIPLLIPEHHAKKGEGWTVFGALPAGIDQPLLPVQPKDPFGTYGALPGEPDALARRFNLAAYGLEIMGGLLLLIGISLNILFIALIIYL
jgi:hypothetical protein